MWDDDSSREVISPDVLPRWSRGAAADALGDDPLTAPAGRVPFAINSAINRKRLLIITKHYWEFFPEANYFNRIVKSNTFHLKISFNCICTTLT